MKRTGPLIWLLLALLLNGCSPRGQRHYRVAAILKSSTNPFFAMMWEGIKSEADRRNIDVELFWPQHERDFDYQTRTLREALSGRYDGVIIAPSNADLVGPLLSDWKRAGRAVIVTDVPVKSGEGARGVDAFIGTDNAAGGRLAAEYADHFLRPGSHVAVVAGFDFDQPRTVAFKAYLKARRAGIDIREFKGQFERGLTREIALKNISYFRTAAVVFCANDHMALGVVDAFKERSIRPMPVIIGYDSTKDAQASILRRDMGASVIQAPARMGTLAVSMLPDIMEGRAVSPETLIAPELTTARLAISHVKESELGGLFSGSLPEPQ